MNKKLLHLSTVDPQAHELARQYGLGIELAEFCTAWNLDDEFPATDRSVRQKLPCSDHFVMHGPYNELFPCAIDRRARALARMRYLQTIRVARGYHIRKIVLHGGFHPRLYFPCWYVEQSVIFWREFVQEIPEDMVICLENVLEEEPEHLADIIRQTDCPRLRMCLDVGHANAYSHASPEQWVRQCADVIGHLHIHNNDGTWDTHSPLDCGTIPMPHLFETIRECCPRATQTLELPEAAPSLVWLQENGIWEES